MTWDKKMLLLILIGWTVGIAAIFWAWNTDLESDRVVIVFGGLFLGMVIETIGFRQIPPNPS